eukprot:226517-Hanusia_phi.AAC.4
MIPAIRAVSNRGHPLSKSGARGKMFFFRFCQGLGFRRLGHRQSLTQYITVPEIDSRVTSPYHSPDTCLARPGMVSQACTLTVTQCSGRKPVSASRCSRPPDSESRTAYDSRNPWQYQKQAIMP